MTEPDGPCTCDPQAKREPWDHRWWCGLTAEEIEVADREWRQEIAGYQAYPQ